MNKEYKIKLDLNKKLYNKKMTFNQFDENVNDFYIEVTKNNEVVKDLNKSIVTLVAIKPDNTVEAQFVEVENGLVYADLKPSMCDLVGNYQAKAMIVLEGKIITTDTIIYSVNEDKIISRLNEDIVSDERFTLFTDALARLSDIEISEEQRMINEAERILSEENRKIEEAKRVEAELVRQHEEADRTKYDAIRESNENIRKLNEQTRVLAENTRLENEANRIEQEANRVKAEQLRKDNYNFMTEDEERRRLEANAHKEAETLRVSAENTRVNEEAKRRTIEQVRVSAENTRVSNENTRKANETTRQTNETHRVEAETQRQNRYNSFIVDAEANANNFENYTNTAKVNEEERKANELDRKSQEAKRVSNEVERISNENTRKANEVTRIESEKQRIDAENLRKEKIIEIQSDYDSLKKVIIDENASANLQNQINQTNSQLEHKANELDIKKADKITVSNLQGQVNNLVVNGAGDSNPEVVQARGEFNLLNERLHLNDLLLNKNIVLNKIQMLVKNQHCMNINGTITPVSSKYCLTYYDVEGLDVVFVDNAILSSPNGSYASYMFTDEEGNVLEYKNNSYNGEITRYFTVPSNSKYLYLGTLAESYINSQCYSVSRIEEELDKKTDLDVFNLIDNKFVIKNLFDKYSEDIKIGYNLGSDGNFYENESVFVTNFIPVTINDTIYGRYNGNAYYVCYDGNKQRIGYGYINNNGSSVISKLDTVSAEKLPTIAYIRFGSALSNIDKMSITTNKQYMNIEHKMLDNKYIDGYNNTNINWWHGKKGDSLGDSLTGQGFFQRYTSMYYNLDSFKNHGVGGSKLSGEDADSSKPSMWKDSRINELRDDADFITILGGQNDGNVEIGEISKTNMDTNTYIGAYNTIIDKIYTKYNGRIQIILCTPFYVPSEGDDGVRFITLGNAVKEIGKLHGLPVADFGGMSGANKYVKDIYWGSDKTHPIEDFYRDKITPILIDTMNKVKPIDYTITNSLEYNVSQ